jgi:hypothetical protein
MKDNDAALRLRRWVYALLITVAVGAAAGRIFAVERVNEPSLHRDEGQDVPLSLWPAQRPPPSPLFGSNDRSRWATIRALVDDGTFAIGERDPKVVLHTELAGLMASNPLEEAVLYVRGFQLRSSADRSIWREKDWEPGYETVDRVLQPETLKFFSSKPPLLSTLVAGLYWLLEKLTGWTLATNLFEVVRVILLLVNVLPFAIYLYLLARLVERFAETDWARLYTLAAACFATLVTPFLVTLNNHTMATFGVVFAVAPALSILCGNRIGKEQGDAAPWYLFVLSGFFASFTACIELPAAAFTVGLGLILLLRAPRKTLLLFVPLALLPVAAFFLTNYLAIGQWRIAYSEFGGPWYEYEGSHWSYPPGTRRGIDFARYRESRATYVFHVLLGHHGLLSLTPVWLLAFAGMFAGLVPRKTSAVVEEPAPQCLPFYFFPASLFLSLIVLGFYLTRTESANYGGWTSGLRWVMWLTPIWLLCMLPVLDRLANHRWGRWPAYALLALSVLSASFPAWNPWRHPWIYRWMDAQGWIPY